LGDWGLGIGDWGLGIGDWEIDFLKKRYLKTSKNSHLDFKQSV
jgi:hypothetical protein